MNQNSYSTETARQGTSRRGFLTRTLAAVFGALTLLVPLAAGLLFFLDPLIRKKNATADGRDDFVRLTTVDALPDDGEPQLFTVIKDKQDAWTRYPAQPVGTVFLRKTPAGDVTAFNQSCPHLGCMVGFQAGQQKYVCPCHDSAFQLDGQKTNDIPPRDLDALKVEIRNDSEVWVQFKNFRAGTAEKVPV